MKKVNLATIVLFSIGTFFGLLILYNNLMNHTTISNHDVVSNSNIISKDRAISIVTNDSRLSQQELGTDVIDAKLLQAKLSNRVAFVIDYPAMTLSVFPKLEPLVPYPFKENQLFWEVSIKHYLSQYGYKQWVYKIDATNGTLIQRSIPIG